MLAMLSHALRPFRDAVARRAVAACDLSLCLELNFSRGGNGLAWLREGWSTPEAERSWNDGHAASLAFLPPAAGRFVLCLDASTLGRQRVTVVLGGGTERHYVFDGRCSAMFPIEIGADQAGRPVGISLLTPDAKSPGTLFGGNDTRTLGIALYRLRLFRRPRPPYMLPPLALSEMAAATGLDPQALMLAFESLGHNCEFGIVQRHFGAEPIGLLRFGGISPHNLLRGLQNDFAGLGEPGGIAHLFWEEGSNPEYIVSEKAYAIQYHAGITAQQITSDALYKREGLRLGFSRRKFLEDIAQGEKIFVFQWPGSLLTRDVLPILEALNRTRRNTLLWVVASDEHPPGSVEILSPHFLRGFVRALAPLGSVDRDVEFGPWLSVCANAYRVKSGATRL